MPALKLDDGEITDGKYRDFVVHRLALGKADDARRHRALACNGNNGFHLDGVHKSFKPLFTPASSADDQANAKKTLTKRFGFLEGSLGDQAFISGEGITVADCYLFVMLMRAKEKAGLTLPSRLSVYYEHLKARPGIMRPLQEEGLTDRLQ